MSIAPLTVRFALEQSGIPKSDILHHVAPSKPLGVRPKSPKIGLSEEALRFPKVVLIHISIYVELWHDSESCPF